MGSCKLDLAVLTSLISHGRLAAPQHTVAASTEEGHLVIEPQLGREMADKMLQSGLSRLKSVLTGGGGGGGGGDHQDRARCCQHGGLVRSSSHNPRSDLARQIISKKLSVPALSLSSSHHQHSHSPVQVSRSVPCQLGQPWQPQHRKLTRAGLSSSQSGHKYRDSIWTRDQHGAKRRKQDLNRNVSYYNNKEWDKDSLSSSESNPEDHIYEEIDSDTLSTQDEEDTEDNFLLSISSERQRNLKFYGSAGWDFGSVM